MTPVTMDASLLVGAGVVFAGIVASHVRLEQVGKMRHESNVERFAEMREALDKIESVASMERSRIEAGMSRVTDAGNEQGNRIIRAEGRLEEHERRITSLEIVR